MFNKADIMEDRKKRKLVRMFKIVGEELTVRDFTNNNLVSMPGKATAEDKKIMLWLQKFVLLWCATPACWFSPLVSPLL